MNTVPLLIEFVRGTSLYREPEVISKLPIVQNGPPGTFVVFADGARVSLPTDQIVLSDDTGGDARVGFGGMSFGGMDDGRLIFHRVRDLQPEGATVARAWPEDDFGATYGHLDPRRRP
jgi:hypothetical protein